MSIWSYIYTGIIAAAFRERVERVSGREVALCLLVNTRSSTLESLDRRRRSVIAHTPSVGVVPDFMQPPSGHQSCVSLCKAIQCEYSVHQQLSFTLIPNVMSVETLRSLEQVRQRLNTLANTIGKLLHDLDSSDPLPSWYATRSCS
jgi:hypothetical protein